jgi:hypothetical protein
LADFQANAATGTANSPYNINDNNTSTIAGFSAVNQYAEVDFGKAVKIDQWRQYGYGHTGTGRWKIQYKAADGTWTDWVTGIPTRTTANWGPMESETEVTTEAIRLVCTTVDGAGTSWMPEFEVYHS